VAVNAITRVQLHYTPQQMAKSAPLGAQALTEILAALAELADLPAYGQVYPVLAAERAGIPMAVALTAASDTILGQVVLAIAVAAAAAVVA
jgi:hypothetical protein